MKNKNKLILIIGVVLIIFLLIYLFIPFFKLKGKREILWRKHKSADENEKTDIFKEIKELTDKIDTIQSQKRACNRIIARYEEIKEDYKKEIGAKEKSKELIIADKKNKKLRNR
jgi:flagellar basal body-associated protein FliL